MANGNDPKDPKKQSGFRKNKGKKPQPDKGLANVPNHIPRQFDIDPKAAAAAQEIQVTDYAGFKMPEPRKREEPKAATPPKNSLADLANSLSKEYQLSPKQDDAGEQADALRAIKAEMDGPDYREPTPVQGALYEEARGESKEEPGEKEYNTAPDKKFQLSLRYRVPKKLAKIDKTKKLEMSQHITRQMRLADDQRTEFLIRLAQYRDAWNNFMKTGILPGYKQGHDVHVPMTFEKVRTMHARIYQAVVGIDPMFSIKPRNVVAENLKQAKEDILQWATKDYANRQQGWIPTIDQDIWNFVADGTSITKHSWERDVRKFVDVKTEIKRPLELDAHGMPVMTEREVEEERVVYDGPMFKPVRLEDVYIIGNYSDNLDDADMVVHRQQYTRSDLIKMAKIGFFDEEATHEVVEKEPNNTYANNAMTNGNLLKDLDDYVTGVFKTDTLAGPSTYTIHEAYFRYDIDDDGIDEELVVWSEETSGEILRITYLERVGPGGKRPFVLKKFIPRQGSFYGIGLAEILFGLNNEIDMLHNMRLDNGSLQNLPFGFYRAASGLNPEKIDLGPGKLIPLDDPQNDVNFPRMNGGTGYGFQEEAAVTTYAEKASGVNEIAMGSTSGQGAARTATGATILANAANAGIDIFIRRYQEGFKQNLHILDLQLQDLLPLGTVIKVVGYDGKDVYRQFTDRDSIKFEVDYCLEGNSANSNKLVERDVALQMLQTFSNPLFIQAGLIDVKNLYNLSKNVLQKFEYRNIDAYVTKPQETEANPYSAKDELSAILAGVRLPKTMMDKHAEKLAFFEEFENSDDFGLLDAEHIPLYQEYKLWHQNMMRAMEANANNPLAQNQGVAPAVAAELAAGAGGTLTGGPAQQIQDMISPNSPLGNS